MRTDSRRTDFSLTNPKEFMERFLNEIHPAVHMLEVTGERLQLSYENQPWMNSRFLHICEGDRGPIFSVCVIRGRKAVEGKWDGEEGALLMNALKNLKQGDVTPLRPNEMSPPVQAEIEGLDGGKFARFVADRLVRAFCGFH